MGPVLDSLQVQAAKVPCKENIVAQAVEVPDTLHISARRRTPDHAAEAGLEEPSDQGGAEGHEGFSLPFLGHGEVGRVKISRRLQERKIQI